VCLPVGDRIRSFNEMTGSLASISEGKAARIHGDTVRYSPLNRTVYMNRFILGAECRWISISGYQIMITLLQVCTANWWFLLGNGMYEILTP